MRRRCAADGCSRPSSAISASCWFDTFASHMARPKGKRMAKVSGASASKRRRKEDLMPDADDADMFQVQSHFCRPMSDSAPIHWEKQWEPLFSEMC